MMVNSEQAYTDCGRRAGKAMRERRRADYDQEARDYVLMYNAEPWKFRKRAEKAYKRAYTLALLNPG